jgi:hypothetical protein
MMNRLATRWWPFAHRQVLAQAGLGTHAAATCRLLGRPWRVPCAHAGVQDAVCCVLTGQPQHRRQRGAGTAAVLRAQRQVPTCLSTALAQVLMMPPADIDMLIGLWSKFNVGINERAGM